VHVHSTCPKPSIQCAFYLPQALETESSAGGILKPITQESRAPLVLKTLFAPPTLDPNPGPHQGKELDYESMAKESRSLAAIIREHSGGKRAEPPDKLMMRAQVSGADERYG
jgi:hypothetical protein